jgi:hypothetical protein
MSSSDQALAKVSLPPKLFCLLSKLDKSRQILPMPDKILSYSPWCVSTSVKLDSVMAVAANVGLPILLEKTQSIISQKEESDLAWISTGRTKS